MSTRSWKRWMGLGILASALLGPNFEFLELKVPRFDGALLLILPPGGFAVLGFLLAGKRAWERRRTSPPNNIAPEAEAGSTAKAPSGGP